MLFIRFQHFRPPVLSCVNKSSQNILLKLRQTISEKKEKGIQIITHKGLYSAFSRVQSTINAYKDYNIHAMLCK